MFDLSQVPAHLPDPLQALRGVEVKLQVPVAQDSQFPSHLPSQQWPSTHKVLLHWLAAVQIEPFGRDVGASGPSFRRGASGIAVVPPVESGASGDETPPEPPEMPPLEAPPRPEPSGGPPAPPPPLSWPSGTTADPPEPPNGDAPSDVPPVPRGPSSEVPPPPEPPKLPSTPPAPPGPVPRWHLPAAQK